jgi:endogenous inhibitor of DNA gyrase (YacG/DUF329 family)
MKCPLCGAEVDWQDTVTFSKLGRDGYGVSNIYDCPKCKTNIIVNIPI